MNNIKLTNFSKMRVEILQFRYDFILNPQHNNAYMQVLSDFVSKPITLTGGPDAKERITTVERCKENLF